MSNKTTDPADDQLTHEDTTDEVATEVNEEETDKPEKDTVEESPTKTDEETPSEDDDEEPKYATPNATETGSGAGVAQTLISLESLIKRYIADIEKLRDQMKTQKDMYNDTFNNDPEYAQVTQKVKEVGRVKATAKQKIQKQPNVVSVNERINELKEEIKDMQDTLSSYLEQYKQMSATNQIVDDNGAAHEIVTVTKLVKKGKYRP